MYVKQKLVMKNWIAVNTTKHIDAALIISYYVYLFALNSIS